MSDPSKDYGFHHDGGLFLGGKLLGVEGGSSSDSEERLIHGGAELVRGAKIHTFRRPGNTGEFHRQHGTEGASLDFPLYIDTESAAAGYELLREMESDATPFIMHPSQVDPRPVGTAGGQTVASSAGWVNMRGLPGLGGTSGDPHNPDQSLRLVGVEERLLEPAAALGTITVGTITADTIPLSWPSDPEELKANVVNPNGSKQRIYGYVVYWKLDTDPETLFARLAQDGDIATTPVDVDNRCLRDFVTIKNPGTGTVDLDVTGLAATTAYDFKIVQYTQFLVTNEGTASGTTV